MSIVAALLAIALPWTFRAGAPIVAAPVAAGANVVIADTQGSVFMLDGKSGKVRWSTVLENGIWSSPLLYRGRIIVSSGDRDFVAIDPPRYAVAGRGESDLVALSMQTGDILWDYNLAGSGAPAAAIDAGTLIHHDGSSEVLALDAINGAYRWRRFVASTAASTNAVIIDANRFATSGAFPNCVLVMRIKDGGTLHQICFDDLALGFAQANIAVDGTRIYGTYYSISRTPVEHLYAIDADRGRVIWNIAAGAGAAGAPLPQLTVEDGIIYAGSPFRDALQAFDAATGAQRWEAPLHGLCAGRPAIAASHVYAADGGGWVTKVDARTGAIVGTNHAGGDMRASAPAIIGGSLFVGSESGMLHAIPLSDI